MVEMYYVYASIQFVWSWNINKYNINDPCIVLCYLTCLFKLGYLWCRAACRDAALFPILIDTIANCQFIADIKF